MLNKPVMFSRVICAVFLLAIAGFSSVEANDCTWDEHPAAVQTAIDALLAPFVGSTIPMTGFWKPVVIVGVPVASTGWDCDFAPDTFEYPGENVFGSDKATIGGEKPGNVLIQPLLGIV